jgi:hypothetical protein
MTVAYDSEEDPLLALLRARHGSTTIVRRQGEAMLTRIAALKVRVQTLQHITLRGNAVLHIHVDPILRVIPAAPLDELIAWHPLDGVPAPEYIPETWDGAHVGKRMIEAFSTLRRLPLNLYPREFGNMWPAVYHEWTDRLAQEEMDFDDKEREIAARNRVKTRPRAVEISRMECAIAWPGHYLSSLDREAQRSRDQAWARAVGLVAWHRSGERELEWIAKRLRMAPATVRRRNRTGLDIIAAGLRRDRVAVF